MGRLTNLHAAILCSFLAATVRANAVLADDLLIADFEQRTKVAEQAAQPESKPA